ncbi:MAG: hypothetical protein LBK00_07915 [Treponema sp.]|nr:hypothetical protein [Treponema sp.]
MDEDSITSIYGDADDFCKKAQRMASFYVKTNIDTVKSAGTNRKRTATSTTSGNGSLSLHH